MKIVPLIPAALFLMFMYTIPAHADACSDRARAMVAGDSNATLLSVKSVKGSDGKVTCEARVKMSSSGSAPRVVVKKFKP